MSFSLSGNQKSQGHRADHDFPDQPPEVSLRDLRSRVPRRRPPAESEMTIATLLAGLLAIILHEAAHIVSARSFGIAVKRVGI